MKKIIYYIFTILLYHDLANAHSSQEWKNLDLSLAEMDTALKINQIPFKHPSTYKQWNSLYKQIRDPKIRIGATFEQIQLLQLLESFIEDLDTIITSRTAFYSNLTKKILSTIQVLKTAGTSYLQLYNNSSSTDNSDDEMNDDIFKDIPTIKRSY